MAVDHGSRLTHVEGEIGGIKTAVAQLKTQMQGLGDILSRIEGGISQAQQQALEEKHASRVNPVALATVLVSIISVLIGGAWLVGGELARHDERSQYQQRMIDRIELRQWQQRPGEAQSGPAEAHP